MNYIKAFIFPTKMKRFRSMTILIAIAIFALSYYAIYFTAKIKIDGRFDEYKAQNVMGVTAFANMPEDIEITDIKNNNYKVDSEGKLTTSLEDNGEYQVFLIPYTKDDVTYKMYFIFDPFNVVNSELLEIQEKYVEYAGEDTNSAAIAQLTYIAKVKDPTLDINTKFAELKGNTEEIAKASEIYPLNYFNITPVATENTNAVIFHTTYFTYTINPFDAEGAVLGPEVTCADGYYNSSLTVDTSLYANASQLGNHIADMIVSAWSQTLINNTTIYMILTVFIFPLIIVFIMWLFFRRKGNLQTFKEYYNIASICAIIPAIITVIVTIFMDNGYQVFSFLLSIFYIFAVAKINMTPEDVN